MNRVSKYYLANTRIPQALVEWQDLETLDKLGFRCPVRSLYVAGGVLTKPWQKHPENSALFLVSENSFYIVEPAPGDKGTPGESTR